MKKYLFLLDILFQLALAIGVFIFFAKNGGGVGSIAASFIALYLYNIHKK